MKKIFALLAVFAFAVTGLAKNPNPKDFTRESLGIRGKVMQATIRDYSSSDKSVLLGVKTYTFTPKGNIIAYKYENKQTGYVLTYSFERDNNGVLKKLSVYNNGKLDSYVIYGKNKETLYSYDGFVVTVTITKGNDRFVYDATMKDQYETQPEMYFQKIHLDLNKAGKVLKETVTTFDVESDRTEFTYNSSGVLVKKETYIDNELDTSVEYRNGHESVRTNENGTRKYTYSLDENNNWISRKTLSESGKLLVYSTQSFKMY